MTAPRLLAAALLLAASASQAQMANPFGASPAPAGRTSSAPPARPAIRPSPRAAAPAAGGFDCSPRTCGMMASCAEARHHLEVCGQRRLDRDGDGVPCESLCR